jgi:hypothetical protein
MRRQVSWSVRAAGCVMGGLIGCLPPPDALLTKTRSAAASGGSLPPIRTPPKRCSLSGAVGGSLHSYKRQRPGGRPRGPPETGRGRPRSASRLDCADESDAPANAWSVPAGIPSLARRARIGARQPTWTPSLRDVTGGRYTFFEYCAIICYWTAFLAINGNSVDRNLLPCRRLGTAPRCGAMWPVGMTGCGRARSPSREAVPSGRPWARP